MYAVESDSCTAAREEAKQGLIGVNAIMADSAGEVKKCIHAIE
jgi:hypothetical protein